MPHVTYASTTTLTHVHAAVMYQAQAQTTPLIDQALAPSPSSSPTQDECDRDYSPAAQVARRLHRTCVRAFGTESTALHWPSTLSLTETLEVSH